MARSVRFRPSYRKQVEAVKRNLDFYGRAGDPNYAPEANVAKELEKLEQSYQTLTAGFAPVKQRAAPRQLEAPVVAAISELLAVHPRVIWAARMNSGAASFESKSGKYKPIWFHKIVRAPAKIRMPDFIGMLRGEDGKTGLPFACECKAPGWRGPRDDREREQSMFLQMVDAWGGIGCFATSAEDVAALLNV